MSHIPWWTSSQGLAVGIGSTSQARNEPCMKGNPMEDVVDLVMMQFSMSDSGEAAKPASQISLVPLS